MLYRLRGFASVCLMRLGAVAIYAGARLAQGSIGKQITLPHSATVGLIGKTILLRHVEIVATPKQPTT